MTPENAVGTVSALWRFPVKSMGGEPLEQVELLGGGIVGDRAFALIETVSGKVVSAKSVKFYPDLLHCRAAFVEPPRAGREIPPVRITLPDGAAWTGGTRAADEALSAHFGRRVTLARAAPSDFTIDMVHPDLESADPQGRGDVVVEQKLGSALFESIGRPSPVAAGAFFDLFPLSVITTSTFDRLNALRPQSQFDPRRFRMNVVVRAMESGFPENGWLRRTLAIGNEARIRVTAPDSRCVMTTLAQGDLPRDVEILRTLARHNRLPVGGAESPCAGVYAVVEAPGTIRAGDRVTLI